jgi:hypothetical protein
MPFKVVTTSFAPVSGSEIIKCIIPVESTAVIKAISKYGDSHTVNGSTSASGITRIPGEMIYGEFTSVEITTGKALVYYTSIVERL